MSYIATGTTGGPGRAHGGRPLGATGFPWPPVAVIGAGVSGLTAAYLLPRTHNVALFEAEERLGGHAHTHDLTDSDGRRHAVDSGFIVHNDVTCVWSAGRETALAYPARYLFRFLDHHGMLQAGGSPQWYSIAGGSRTYVERLAGPLKDVRAARAVTDVTRRQDGVELRDVTGQVTRMDRVVIATHADQALGLLTDPSDGEAAILKQFGYSANVAVLRTDGSVLPEARNGRASWNYRMTSCDRPSQAATVTYWMNRLQGHRSPEDFLVTLNDRELLEPRSVAAVMDCEHPVYTAEVVRAQSQLAGLATDRTVYAGAYHGWGFHEDGCRSGVEAARHFGVTW